MRPTKVQASLRIRAVSPEPPLLAHTSIESRGTFRQKAKSLAPMNGWACAVKICHDGMLEDTNSLDGARIIPLISISKISSLYLVSIAEQAGLSLTCSQTPKTGSLDEAHLCLYMNAYAHMNL